jgi:hypothetical protein
MQTNHTHEHKVFTAASPRTKESKDKAAEVKYVAAGGSKLFDMVHMSQSERSRHHRNLVIMSATDLRPLSWIRGQSVTPLASRLYAPSV